MPFLDQALDPALAQAQLQRVLPQLGPVTAATLVRHRSGRRALVAYSAATPTGPTVLLGKLRAKGTDLASYRVQRTLWESGWAADSPDGLSVPEPIGVVPAWHMTLQRWVPGTPATQSLATPQGLALASRIAALAHKLHCTPVPTAKVHTLADELHILRQRLPLVAQQHPAWAARLDHILTRCQHRAAPFLAAPSPQALPPTGIHRDFYADQVLVDGDRLWLVDLDLYCQGSPALDLGNFIAHITEQSLRQLGDPGALADRETALREAFIALTPHRAEALGAEIELYTLLTLVRHIHISQRITSRRPYTEALMVLCEARL